MVVVGATLVDVLVLVLVDERVGDTERTLTVLAVLPVVLVLLRFLLVVVGFLVEVEVRVVVDVHTQLSSLSSLVECSLLLSLLLRSLLL